MKDLNFLGCEWNDVIFDLNNVVADVDLQLIELENGRIVIAVADSS